MFNKILLFFVMSVEKKTQKKRNFVIIVMRAMEVNKTMMKNLFVLPEICESLHLSYIYEERDNPHRARGFDCVPLCVCNRNSATK